MDLDTIKAKIFILIVKKLYKKYGFNVLFRESDFKVILKKQFCVVYRAQSRVLNNEYLYNIQLHKFDIKKNKGYLNYHKKCIFCKKMYTDYKLTCCGKYTHLNCYFNNGNIGCCNHLQKEIEEEECVVCLEPTNTTTKCNHRLCNECMTNIKKTGLKNLCPMCRGGVDNFMKSDDEIYRVYFNSIDSILVQITYI